MNPLVLGSANRILSRATSLQVNATQVITIGPGEPAQVVHRDQWAFDRYPFAKDYQVIVNTIWAMTDFTAQNGATRVVVGSHTFEDKLTFTEGDTEPAEMSKGSVFLYLGTTYHGGGANRSEADRIGIAFSYSVSWLRQEENQYLAVPLEIARTLPEELLRLMGYQRGAYALGYSMTCAIRWNLCGPILPSAGWLVEPNGGGQNQIGAAMEISHLANTVTGEQVAE